MLWSPHRILFAGGVMMLVIAVWFLINTNNEEINTTIDSPILNPYARPMCDAQGFCGEHPSVPSPRTMFSARTETEEKEWFQFHEKLIKSAHHYQLSKSNDETQDVVFIGDSITESFLGTSYDEDANPRLVGVKEVFANFCEERNLNPLVLAISGDQTQHLLWRLQNGELSNNLKSNPEITFVLHIGTNNIGSGFLPPESAAGIIRVAEYLLEETKGKLVMVLLLPRGDGQVKLLNFCPPRCDNKGAPFLSYLKPLQQVNELLTTWFHALAIDNSKQYGNKVDVVSCWDLFINQNNNNRHVHDKDYDLENEVRLNLMPDKLHPNAQGHDLFLHRIATKL